MKTQGMTTMDPGKTFTLDDLQSPPTGGAFCPPGVVADSMAALAAGGHIIEVPSLVALSGFYGCNNLVIYDALRILKGRGYDYRLRGIDNPIAIWRTAS